MIPTVFKSKLPGHLSYPIGAEALSQVILNSFDASSVGLMFGSSDWPASGPKRLLADRSPQLILVTEFWPANYRGNTEEWYLHVYAVPRNLRQLANQLLREQGLPELARWFQDSGQPGWRSRRQQLTLKLLAIDGSLIIDSTSGAGVAAWPAGRSDLSQEVT
jgi:hypothetical protein